MIGPIGCDYNSMQSIVCRNFVYFHSFVYSRQSERSTNTSSNLTGAPVFPRHSCTLSSNHYIFYASRTHHRMAESSEMKSNQDAQQAEINSLSDYFKDNIRILSSIGQFSYILKIPAQQYGVSLTLQLDGSYPSKPPEIIITAPRLIPGQITVVQQLLQSYAETLCNQPMILLIYSRLLQWFEENNIQSLNANDTTSSTPRSPINAPSIPIPNHNRNPSNDECDNEQTKKTSMKTADDVISRIEWDNRLDKRFFRVGYVDRFLGLQEKSFTDFDFKVDLSTVSDRHSNILAIPKHRIQYFKYANEIIWDKETRTDLMFGSTGNQETIEDVIKRHENLVENNDSSSPISDNDTIEENNIEIPPPRYLTLTDGTYKPNYFLSIPITDQTLIKNYIAYRDHLLSSHPTVFNSRTNSTDPPHLHLTLLTLRIETPAQVDQCKAALKRFQQEIRYHCSYPEPICLEFQSVETFYDRVLYVKCRTNQRLENLRTLIIERFCEQQKQQNLNEMFFAGNYLEYVPHITLLKCKRKFSSLRQNDNQEIHFGKQTIDSLQLCSIGQQNNDQSNDNCIFKLDLN